MGRGDFKRRIAREAFEIFAAICSVVLNRDKERFDIGLKDTLDLALQASGCDQVHVVHMPRLHSSNWFGNASGDLTEWLQGKGMKHSRGAPHQLLPGRRLHSNLPNGAKLKVRSGADIKISRTAYCFGLLHAGQIRLAVEIRSVCPKVAVKFVLGHQKGPPRDHVIGIGVRLHAGMVGGGALAVILVCSGVIRRLYPLSRSTCHSPVVYFPISTMVPPCAAIFMLS